MSAAPEPPPTAPKPATKPGEWKELPDPNEHHSGDTGIAFNDHQFLVIGGDGGRLVVFGGDDLENQCEYYDTKTGKWHEFPKFPYDFTHGSVAKSGDRVFVLGGEGDETLNGLFSIHVPGADLSSAAGGTWKALAKMKQKRRHFACEYDSKYIYAFGGQYYNDDENKREYLNSAERYDILADKWESLPPMPGGPRAFCAAGRVGDKIYIVGGSDENENLLASTIVFDTARGRWESTDDDTALDMNTARDDCAVVVVDQFVIAIGGQRKSREGIRKRRENISSIEVLDTQENTWAYAPTSMTGEILSLVSGFLKDTREIIVVHGRSAESIHFESGLKPRSTSRGQKMLGDHARGEDKLNLRTIAVAIANSLLFKDLKPPFVVGILGKWGRGKSFFFNMIEEQIIQIQKLPADGSYKDTYAGHIYVIEFSAWEFSEGDIWSSLMYKILKDLNMQLQFEHEFLKHANDPQKRSESENLRTKIDELQKQIVGLHPNVSMKIGFDPEEELQSRTIIGALKKCLSLDKRTRKKIDNLRQEQNNFYHQWRKLEKQIALAHTLTTGGISTVEMFRKLSDGEIKYLQEDAGDGVWTAFQEIWKNGDQASETLLQAINFKYEKDQDELELLEANIKIQRIKDQKQRVLKLFTKMASIMFEKYLDYEVKKSEKAVEKYEKAIKNEGVDKKNQTNAPPKAYKGADGGNNNNLQEAKKELAAIKSIDTLVNDISFFGRLDPSFASTLAVICLVVFAVAALLLVRNFDNIPFLSNLEHKTLTEFALFIPAVGSFVTCLASGSRNIRETTEELLKEEMTPSKDMQDLLNKKNEIRDRAGALKGRSLKETMEEIDAEEYEKNLSIIHRVHTHLKLMSESMVNQRRPEQFPRGPPRIVMFVDDLDRCDYKTVVKVLEAIQLLVSHELFTAIVAIDPRYVTKSIEKEYSGVLQNQRAPTGMDYLEKFIQIPFRLPDVGQDKMDVFIDSLMGEPEVDESPSQTQSQGLAPDSAEFRVNSITDPSESKPSIAGDEDEKRKKDVMEALPRAPHDSNETTTVLANQGEKTSFTTKAFPQDESKGMPRIRIPFEAEERNMIKNVVKIFGVEPRCMKRIINVYKLLKVIWKKDSSYNEEDKEDILFMMLLASDITTRHVTFNIFDWMESGSVQFHRVMQGEQGELMSKNNLASVFRKELKKQDESMVRVDENNESNKGFLMEFIDQYLSKYSWEDIDGWNKVSSRFLLARCFSFFCLVPSATDTDESDDYRERNVDSKTRS